MGHIRKYDILRINKQLYDKATRTVQLNGKMGERLSTTIRVKQECLLSLILFNIFLERIVPDALEEHDRKIIIGGRNITNLRFTDDIGALNEEEQELEDIVESLDKTCGRYKVDNKMDNKHRQWHPERDQGKPAEAGCCNKLQVPLSASFI